MKLAVGMLGRENVPEIGRVDGKLERLQISSRLKNKIEGSDTKGRDVKAIRECRGAGSMGMRSQH